MPHIEVESGVTLHVQDVGAGRPVVLIAGFGLSHPVWDRQVRVLLDAGHRVVCIDLRGTGLSDKPAGGYDLDRMAQDVAVVLDELDLHDVTLVGWSLGGQVSFHLAAVHPERIGRLVLVTSNAVRASRSEQFPFGAPREALESALVTAERGDRLGTRRGMIARGFAGEPPEDVLDHLHQVQLAMPSWAAVATFASYLGTDLTPDLDHVRIPVVQIMGEKDPVMPLKGARWLQERLTDGRLVVLEGCGHYPMFEVPDAFDDALQDAARA